MSPNQKILDKISCLLSNDELQVNKLINNSLYDDNYEQQKTYGFTAQVILNENDGDGNDARVVFKITTNDGVCYVRICGTYSSWDSTIWYPDTLQEVRHAKVTSLEWIAVDGSDDEKFLSVQ